MSKVTVLNGFVTVLTKTYRVNDETLTITKYSVSVYDISFEYLMKFKYFVNVGFYMVFPVLFIFVRTKEKLFRSFSGSTTQSSKNERSKNFVSFT